jgi:hypothetical protein
MLGCLIKHESKSEMKIKVYMTVAINGKNYLENIV